MISNEKTEPVDATTLAQIKEIIDIAMVYRDSYLHSPPCDEYERKRMAAEDSKPLVCWQEGRDTYTAKYTVRASAYNYYAKGEYTKNGKTTNLKAIKNSYQRLLSLRQGIDHNVLEAGEDDIFL